MLFSLFNRNCPTQWFNYVSDSVAKASIINIFKFIFRITINHIKQVYIRFQQNSIIRCIYFQCKPKEMTLANMFMQYVKY